MIAKGVQNETVEMLGKLKRDEYLAAKMLFDRYLHVKHIRDGELYRLDSYGNASRIQFGDISNGDTIRIGVTVSNMLGGPEQTGMLTIKNVQDHMYDPQNGELVLQGSDFGITTIDCRDAMRILDIVIHEDNWVNKESLSTLVSGLPLSEYEQMIERAFVHEIQNPNRQVGFDDFGFGGLFQADPTFSTPDLKF